ASLQFDHDSHAVAVALVANVGDVLDNFVVHQLCDALDQTSLVHLVRDFGDDNRLPVLVECFYAGLGAHHEAATAGFVGIVDASLPMNDAVGGEVGAFHDFQNFRQLGRRVVHQRDGGVHNLRQVVWRNFRGHADRDSVGAIHQQIRNPRG